MMVSLHSKAAPEMLCYSQLNSTQLNLLMYGSCEAGLQTQRTHNKTQSIETQEHKNTIRKNKKETQGNVD